MTRSYLRRILLACAAAAGLHAQTVRVYPLFLTATDFNHDGSLDLAVADSALGEGGSIAILLLDLAVSDAGRFPRPGNISILRAMTTAGSISCSERLPGKGTAGCLMGRQRLPWC